MTRGRLASLVALGALLAAGGAAQQPGSGQVVTSLTLFAGTGEGLFRSLDWSGSWSRVEGRTTSVGLEGLGAARSLVLLTTQVWVGGDGIWVSEDFGETWKQRARTRGVEVLLPSRWPQSDPTVFAGTGFGLLRSRDGGRSFQSTALNGGAVYRAEWPGPALVVACDQGVLVTTDEGMTFSGPGAGLPPGPVRAMALSSFFSADPVVFAGPDSGGVFRSGDGGATWRASGLAGQRVGDFIWLGPFLYAAADGGFFRSEDAGTSWVRLSASPGRPRQLLFPLAPAAGLEAFLATDAGLYHTHDAGEHWELAGFAGQEVLTIATFPAPEVLLQRPKKR
jgi:photosystem II stability/assembly factor-like uncharacterized protein